MDGFPVFLLGAVFGKVIELSGFSKAIVAAVIRLIGRERAMLACALIMLWCVPLAWVKAISIGSMACVCTWLWTRPLPPAE